MISLISYVMRDRNNPLRNIAPHSFTIIQASHADFLKYLADIPIRYPDGRITYINNHQFVPLLILKEEHQDRLDHLIIPTLSDLFPIIESDQSAILFIEYHLAWFGVDKPEEMLAFNDVCRRRAQERGPVLLITAVMDRVLLALDGKADYFFQFGKIQFRRGRPVNREQTGIDSFQPRTPVVMEKGRMYGQTRLVDW